MFYFLHGDNSRAVAEKANSLVAELIKKKPDASFFTLTDENWNDAVIEEYVASQGLFENKYIVLVKNIFSGPGISAADKKARREVFLEKIGAFAESPNIFIVAEDVTDKVSLKKIEKHAQKVQEFSDKKSDSAGSAKRSGKNTDKDEFKIFDLADALGARDKKRLWTLYRQAVDAGKVPEEIHGILFWQMKNMIIAARTKTATEAGLNPFVFDKAKRYASNFSEPELRAILGQLVSVYHDAHRGIHDFETALEVFILEKI
jgi:DNA polymerase III delta subunit